MPPRERPRSWNDDVVWLLSRLLGLGFAQGPGTESDAIPLGAPVSPVLHYLRLLPTDLTSTSVVTLQMPATGTQWALVACQAHHLSGSGTAWAPRVGQTAAFADDGPDDRLGFASQATATPFRKAFCVAVPMQPDVDDRLYLKPGLDAGSDNDLDVQLWFGQVVKTEGSS